MSLHLYKKWLIWSFILMLFLLVGIVYLFLTSRELFPIKDYPTQVAITDPAYESEISQAHPKMLHYLSEAHIPGCTIAIYAQGKIIWSVGYGYADIKRKVWMQADTKLRIASISKAVTSVGLGKLVEEGKLELGQYVRHYLPAFPSKKYPITIAHLASHLGGIRHYTWKDRVMDLYLRKHYRNVKEGLERYEEDPLVRKPGEQFFYSSYGYHLLSVVMESRAETSFEEWMERHVFEPLQMEHTVMDDLAHYPIENRATLYRKNMLGRLRLAHEVDVSYKWAGGGMLSTSEDLMRLAKGLCQSNILSQEIIDTLFATQYTAAGAETGYGIGWWTFTDAYRRKMVFHTGSVDGGSGILILYPHQDAAIAINTNINSAGAPQMRELAFNIILPFLVKIENNGVNGAAH